MSWLDEPIPALSATLQPPLVLGTADLADFAYQGHAYDDLLARIDQSVRRNPTSQLDAARLYDQSIALQLAFRRAQGLDQQDEALAISRIYRVRGATNPALRLLAVVGPGDLMVNTPLDFLTNHLDVRLDLLYVVPDQPLPPVIPDHDIAFFATGETDPATFARLVRLFDKWPRPALNDPRHLPALERDTLARSLAGVPGVCSPTAVAVSRAQLDQHLEAGMPIPGFDTERGPYPCLIRPASSHAGIGLKRAADAQELADYLRFSFDRQFYLTSFEDYASPDGQYRKYRIAFIDRIPFLCHMAISSHWMVHYLNAGMTESAAKRDEEAQAMAGFDTGFARRHQAAFAELHQRLGFDYYSIDCAETRDGRLLVFEADAAAIIHQMDPPDLFPYKAPQMRRVFDAFGDLLRRRAHAAAAA